MKYLRYYAALVLLITGLLGFKMLFTSDGAGATSAATRCTAVERAAGTLQTQIADAKGSPNLERQLMTTIAHLIVNDQQCFPAEAVATMQTFLDH